MKLSNCALVLFLACAAPLAASSQVPLPSFLPEYYVNIIGNGGKPWQLVGQAGTNGSDRAIFESTDGTRKLIVENIACERPTCQMYFGNMAEHLNQQITSNTGAFAEITESDLHAEVIFPDSAQSVLAFILPRSIQTWTWMRPPEVPESAEPIFQAIRKQVNRQRYEEARQEGNVSLGHWGPSIHDYAMYLLRDGKRDQALVVLKDLLETSPYDFEAHLAFMTNTPDGTAASNSAKVVFRNAEDIDPIDIAAQYLGKGSKTIDSFPILSTNDTGLRLVLIPLPPCNPWLLDEAAKVYEQITDIPVSIRRLDASWEWKTPERIARQREIQRMLAADSTEPLDFTGWSPERYFEEIRKAVESESALTRWGAQHLIEDIASSPGQYNVDPYLNRLVALLKDIRSSDKRTMYVGITQANIYAGDSNYVFSQAQVDPPDGAALLSYFMMLGSTLGEEPGSRQRLVERMAKSLAATSIWQLGIPKSTDPSCPTSYPNGVQRLDQQTLVLSDEVKAALADLRTLSPETNSP